MAENVRVKITGEETVDGVDSYVLGFDVDMGAYFEANPALASMFDPLKTTASSPSSRGDLAIWLISSGCWAGAPNCAASSLIHTSAPGGRM